MVGITLNEAVVAAEFTWAGETEATPDVDFTFCCMVLSSCCWSAELSFGSLTTTTSGPFTPTPKPWEIRS